MSDEDYEYDYCSDEEEYDYGSDQDDVMDQDDNDNNSHASNSNNPQIEIENSFYEADDLKDENIEESISLFEKVVQLESELLPENQIKWRFKALNNLITLYYRQNNFNLMLIKYRALLLLINYVTRNECTDAIHSILDTIAASTSKDFSHLKTIIEMYEVTLEALKNSQNERLWMNTKLKLAKIFYEARDIANLETIIYEIKVICEDKASLKYTDPKLIASHTVSSPFSPNSILLKEEIWKKSILIELYTLELQLCSLLIDASEGSNALNNSISSSNYVLLPSYIYHQRRHFIYSFTSSLISSSTVNDPRVLGLLYEEGGCVFLHLKQWEEAFNIFFEAFRNHQEAGSMSRAKRCLKFLVISSLLAATHINPFAAREVKVFQDDPEIIAMQELRECLEANDLIKFESIIKNPKNLIETDSYLMQFLKPLRVKMREEAILNFLSSYSRLKLSFLSESLKLSYEETLDLCSRLIISGRLPGVSIDEPNGEILISPLVSNSNNTSSSNAISSSTQNESDKSDKKKSNFIPLYASSKSSGAFLSSYEFQTNINNWSDNLDKLSQITFI